MFGSSLLGSDDAARGAVTSESRGYFDLPLFSLAGAAVLINSALCR